MDFRKSKLFFPAVFFILAVIYSLPMLLKLRYWGIRDWDLFSCVAAIPAGSILHYGQFPFWNPYLSGGNILFHHPEVAVLTPFILLYLIFGAIIGLKLQVLICYFLGFWGSHKFFQELGISPLSAAVAAIAYFGSVHFALHFAEGHMPFTHFAFLPWFLYFVLRAGKVTAGKHWRGVIWASVMLALMILGNGGAVPFVYTMIFSFLFIGLRAVQTRQLTELKNLLLATFGGVGLAAVKVIPMVIYLLQNKWIGNPNESIPFSALGVIFFGTRHSLFASNFTGQYWRWHEYGAYISPVLALFAIVALAVHFRKHVTLLLVALFFLLLGVGHFASWSPWAFFTSLPGFSSMRCSGRAFQFVILSFSVLGGFGIDYMYNRAIPHLRKKQWQHLGRALIIIGAVVVIGTNIIFALPIIKSAFTKLPVEVSWSETFRNVVDKEPHAYLNYLQNKGSLISPWLSACKPSRGLVGPNDTVYSEYILQGKATVIARDYTPNRISYTIRGDGPGEMVIGMGYDVGWRSEDGRPLKEVEGLIAFPFTKGTQTVVLRYRTPYFYHGLVVSALFLFVMMFGWYYSNQKKQ